MGGLWGGGGAKGMLAPLSNYWARGGGGLAPHLPTPMQSTLEIKYPKTKIKVLCHYFGRPSKYLILIISG